MRVIIPPPHVAIASQSHCDRNQVGVAFWMISSERQLPSWLRRRRVRLAILLGFALAVHAARRYHHNLAIRQCILHVRPS